MKSKNIGWADQYGSLSYSLAMVWIQMSIIYTMKREGLKSLQRNGNYGYIRNYHRIVERGKVYAVVLGFKCSAAISNIQSVFRE